MRDTEDFLGFNLPSPRRSVQERKRTGSGSKNDKVRLFLGTEGGHIYRWQIKGLDHRDLTMPGESGHPLHHLCRHPEDIPWRYHATPDANPPPTEEAAGSSLRDSGQALRGLLPGKRQVMLG